MPDNDEYSLDDLRVFLAVTEAGGFRSAAKTLAISASAVSETISRLEKKLGTPLLMRSTRSVMLTEAGSALHSRLAPLFRDVHSALAETVDSSMEPRGTLKLNVPGAVMIDILPPILDRFMARYPKVRIEIVLENSFVDTIAAGCDAGIRYGEHLAQDMIAVPIGPRRQQFACAASPGYWAARGKPTHPTDLLQHDTIRFRFRSGALAEWEFEQDGKSIPIDPPGRVIMSTEAMPAALELASAGRGVICTFRNWLDPLLETGKLEPALENWWPSFDGPRLYVSSRFMPAHLRAFIDML